MATINSQAQKVVLESVQWTNSEIEDGQTVLGTASDLAVGLKGLRQQLWEHIIDLKREHNDICLAATESAEAMKDKTFIHRSCELSREIAKAQLFYEVLGTLFWDTIREQFKDELEKLSGYETVGIAKDHQVYWQPTESLSTVLVFSL